MVVVLCSQRNMELEANSKQTLSEIPDTFTMISMNGIDEAMCPTNTFTDCVFNTCRQFTREWNLVYQWRISASRALLIEAGTPHWMPWIILVSADILPGNVQLQETHIRPPADEQEYCLMVNIAVGSATTRGLGTSGFCFFRSFLPKFQQRPCRSITWMQRLPTLYNSSADLPFLSSRPAAYTKARCLRPSCGTTRRCTGTALELGKSYCTSSGDVEGIGGYSGYCFRGPKSQRSAKLVKQIIHTQHYYKELYERGRAHEGGTLEGEAGGVGPAPELCPVDVGEILDTARDIDVDEVRREVLL
ncbi:hypothetical protein EDD85DRAFT_793408 [Armillaria nabsnona]|nr:hypothetical protein EDD85DRAFT_793408 [Armillaria nabsnona]